MSILATGLLQLNYLADWLGLAPDLCPSRNCRGGQQRMDVSVDVKSPLANDRFGETCCPAESALLRARWLAALVLGAPQMPGQSASFVYRNHAAKVQFRIGLRNHSGMTASAICAALQREIRRKCKAMLRERRRKVQGPESPHCVSSGMTQRRSAMAPAPVSLIENAK